MALCIKATNLVYWLIPAGVEKKKKIPSLTQATHLEYKEIFLH